MSSRKDEDFLQAIAGVAKLGGFTLKGVSTADDFETRTVTVKFTRISDGHVQEAFDWEREPVLQATTDANGHVEKVETLQPGDLAETAAEADAEIAAAAETNLCEVREIVGQGVIDGAATTITRITPAEGESDPPRDPNQPLVGELAAAAKRRK